MCGIDTARETRDRVVHLISIYQGKSRRVTPLAVQIVMALGSIPWIRAALW